MANGVKAVSLSPGTTDYTGAGRHPFPSGEVASVPAEYADDLVGPGVVEPLAIDIPRITVRVLKAQRTLAGDAVEADRIDGVASGDMPQLLVFWREEGEDVSGGSGPPAFAMEFTLAWCSGWWSGQRGTVRCTISTP